MPVPTSPGLQTRAELKGDYFIINGQKVWTSGAQYADRMFLLARTDPDAPKHKGISYLIIDDMKSAGVEVRPLVVMNGHHHFNEVFFDNVQNTQGEHDRPAQRRLEGHDDHAGLRARDGRWRRPCGTGAAPRRPGAHHQDRRASGLGSANGSGRNSRSS